MIKLIFYTGLAVIGIVASLFSPIAGAITAVSAYLLNPSIFADDPSTFRLQLWCTLAFLAGCLLRRRRGARRVGNEAFVLWAMWAFVGIGALSAAWAVVSSQIALESIYEVFKTVLVSVFLVRAIRDEKDFRYLILACIVGVWHASALFTFGVHWGYVPSEYGRGSGSAVPDPQTAVLLLFAPMLVLLAIKGSKLERIASWVALPFVLDALVETYERTALVGLAVEGVLLLLLLPKRLSFRLLPGIAVALALFVFRLTPEDYWARMNTILAPTEEASANSRFIINDASWAMLRDYPMGVGYRNYPYVSPRYLDAGLLTNGLRSAHNSFFTVACETGYFGLAIWLSAFVGALWLLRRIRKAADSKNLTPVDLYAMGLEIGLYGWLVGGLTQSYHEVDPAYWFVALSVVPGSPSSRENRFR